MLSDIIFYFKLAAKVANTKNDCRHFRLGAVGIRKDGAMVFASNGPTIKKNPRAHCEFRLSRKLDCGSTIYLARVLKNGHWGLAKPCPACQNRLYSKGVKRIYFSTGDSRIFDILEF